MTRYGSASGFEGSFVEARVMPDGNIGLNRRRVLNTSRISLNIKSFSLSNQTSRSLVVAASNSCSINLRIVDTQAVS